MPKKLKSDEAILACLIAAMDANDHVSREELTRAHHLISSMRKFRRRSGETVARDIERTRNHVERRGPGHVIAEGARDQIVVGVAAGEFVVCWPTERSTPPNVGFSIVSVRPFSSTRRPPSAFGR